MRNGNTRAGFTILELMVVVAIIGILATIAVQKWREYQANTRDNIRKTTLVQLSKALEVYYIRHRTYPRTVADSTLWSGYAPRHGSKGFTGDEGYIPGLAPDYISQLPKDPLADFVTTCEDCGYLYQSDGTGYKLLSHAPDGQVGGPEVIPKAGEPFHDPQRTTRAMMVCEGATACTW